MGLQNDLIAAEGEEQILVVRGPSCGLQNVCIMKAVYISCVQILQLECRQSEAGPQFGATLYTGGPLQKTAQCGPVGLNRIFYAFTILW